jgi:hypothetical protein
MMSVTSERVTIKKLTEMTGVSESTVRRKLNDLRRTDKQYRDRVSMNKEGKTRILLVDRDYILPFLSQYIPTPEPEPDKEPEQQNEAGRGFDNGFIAQTLNVLEKQLEAQNKVIFGLQEQLGQQTKLNFVFQEQLRQLKAPTNSEMKEGGETVETNEPEPTETHKNTHQTLESVKSEVVTPENARVEIKPKTNRQLVFYQVTLFTILIVIMLYLLYSSGIFNMILTSLSVH